MGLYYFDASALVKYYVLEPGSTWIRGLIDARSDASETRLHTVFISEASIAESAAAFAVLHRMKRISRTTRDRVFSACMKDIKSALLHIIPVVTADFQSAAYLTQRHPLKGYDAVQLATALRHRQALSVVKLTLTFVSGDANLLGAAQKENLSTENPFDHVLPPDTFP